MSAPHASLGHAFEVVFAAHRGQHDQAGEPYLTHLVRVLSRVDDPDAQIVALLHDVVEDTDVTLATLSETFAPEIVAAVDAMTKRNGETYAAYLQRVKDNPLALIVKRADVADNSDPVRLARLDPEKRARLETKYAAARAALSDNEEVK